MSNLETEFVAAKKANVDFLQKLVVELKTSIDLLSTQLQDKQNELNITQASLAYEEKALNFFQSRKPWLSEFNTELVPGGFVSYTGIWSNLEYIQCHEELMGKSGSLFKLRVPGNLDNDDDDPTINIDPKMLQFVDNETQEVREDIKIDHRELEIFVDPYFREYYKEKFTNCTHPNHNSKELDRKSAYCTPACTQSEYNNRNLISPPSFIALGEKHIETCDFVTFRASLKFTVFVPIQ